VAAVLAKRLVAVVDNLSGIADCHRLSVPICGSVHNPLMMCNGPRAVALTNERNTNALKPSLAPAHSRPSAFCIQSLKYPGFAVHL
jgi:hypothetical protein